MPSSTMHGGDGYVNGSEFAGPHQAIRMLTWGWAERLKGQGVTFNTLNPGLVKTDLNRNNGGFFKIFFAIMMPLIGKTPAAGADTIVWLAASPEAEGVTGKYFQDRREKPDEFQKREEVDKLFKLCGQQTSLERAS